jgi:hypothetical protein
MGKTALRLGFALVSLRRAGTGTACASRAKLSSAATLQSLFIRAVSDRTAFWQNALNLAVRSWNNVNTYQFTDTPRRCGTGVCRRFYGTNVAANEYCDIARADIFLTNQPHVCGLDHCIGGLNGTDKTFGLDHSQSL